ncbi:MAG: cytochrome C oxidase subunit IV family protein [Flammeovirgaceae bacterium]|nr:cytochrome C oxidase subunit IV family protein [Flammeovirgaceae bacterium]
MAHASHEPQVVVLPPNKEKIKKLWTVAGILLFVTVIEFIIAFTMDSGVLKTTTFVLLTIVKAGYIVGEFMHLKYEAKILFWSILIPMVFVIWMLVAFVYEGLKIGEVNFL